MPKSNPYPRYRTGNEGGEPGRKLGGAAKVVAVPAEGREVEAGERRDGVRRTVQADVAGGSGSIEHDVETGKNVGLQRGAIPRCINIRGQERILGGDERDTLRRCTNYRRFQD